MKVIQRFHPVIILPVIIIFFLGNKLIPLGDRFIGSFDTQLHFWNFYFIREQIFNGNLPFWNPYYYCGQPFLANPVVALFYPSTLLFLTLPFPMAFNIDIVAHLFIASTGAYFLVYKLTGRKRAGIASAIIYCLNGYFLIRIFTGHLNLYHAAALIPWIFLCIEKFIQTSRKSFIIAAGGLVGLQILSGDAQTCYYTSLMLAVFYFFRHILRWYRYQSFTTLWKSGLLLTLVPMIAVGIGAVQIIPSMEFISNSQRAENSYEYSTYRSFPPENFFTFLVPHPKDSLLTIDGEFTGYAGIFSILLGLIGAFFSKNREYRNCFGIVLILSVIIMLGHYTPIFQIFYNFVPMVSSFRIPSRCMIMILLCLAVFAGFGVQHILEFSFTKKQNSICIAVGSILLILIISGSNVFQIKILSIEVISAVLFTIASILILLWIRYSKRTDLISIAILLLIFADLYKIYATQIPTLDQNEIFKKQPFEKNITDTGYDRVMMPLVLYNLSRGHYFQLFHANGNASAVTGDLYRFMHEMAGVPIQKFKTHTFNPDIFDKDRIFSSKVMGIKYGIQMNESGEGNLLKASIVMPRAVMVKRSLIIPDLQDQIDFMKMSVFNPMKLVLLQEPVDGHTDGMSAKETTAEDKTRITRYESNQFTIETSSEDDSYLVLSELFYPGWRAWVDGKEVPILRANFLLRAVSLKSGNHQILFRFEQQHFITGAIITGLTLLCTVIYFFSDFRKREPA